ncbi:MAG: Asp-tRNA(Asn)/Glu-tRNA(Gln) amidotransferase subunit GatC [Candidatus Magasanikbacteria bacterium]|nr:Asp-tRNA(Asn)/Glu-tRNA(Gln) amidotransferase subunit GatC [Candidatus Magasanikbacteria bacterium]
MAISLKEVRKIASLARLELTPEEEQRHAETISAVLDYMKVLNEVDTSRVEATEQVTGLTNIFREDEPVSGGNRNELIDEMPEVYAGELVVPGVFADEEEKI